LWHVRHLEDPRSTTPRSLMPPYAWLLEKDLDLGQTQKKLEVHMMLGVPYTIQETEQGVAHAQRQAADIAAEIEAQGGPTGLQGKEIIAVVAYLQRLGMDLKREQQSQGGGNGVAKLPDGGTASNP
jgi:cbb3-type cytochrome oxidase cytochrome c subunit